MKTIFVFICLKMVELLAIIFVPWGIGLIVTPLSPGFFHFPVWVNGFGAIIIFATVACLGFAAIIVLVLKNWEWAHRITQRRRMR